jgi:hypothetical protein
MGFLVDDRFNEGSQKIDRWNEKMGDVFIVFLCYHNQDTV